MKGKTFTEVSLCSGCDGVVVQHFAGDEGWGVCDDCGTVEGDTYTVFECSECFEISGEQKCNCKIK